MKSNHLKFLFAFAIFILISKANAQNQFLNCNNQTPIQNVIVNNAENNSWIGNTNNNGYLNIPDDVKSIIISHPNFGTISINNFGKEICLDDNAEYLEELVIENGANVKTEILEVLENSYKKYKKDNKGKRYFQIDFKIKELQKTLESFNGILALGSFFNTSFNNYTLKWDKSIKNNKSYKKIPSYEYISHTEQAIFTNKKSYQFVQEFIKNNKVQKIQNEFIVYTDDDENFITFTVDREKKLIEKYQNTEVINRKKPFRFEIKDEILMGKVEVIFNLAEVYHINSLSVEEKYLIDGNILESESFIKQEKLTKEEQKKLVGNGIIGFVFDYTEQFDSIQM